MASLLATYQPPSQGQAHEILEGGFYYDNFQGHAWSLEKILLLCACLFFFLFFFFTNKEIINSLKSKIFSLFYFGWKVKYV